MIDWATGGGVQVIDQCECRAVAGACCWPSGVCTMQTEQSCVDGGATYQGDNTDCVDVDCPTMCNYALAPQCMGDCGPGETCVPTAPLGSGALGGGAQVVEGPCQCVTPTATPSATPTSTPTVTPTNTKVPDGSDCDDPADCASGNCVQDVCCDTPCDQLGEICNAPGEEGTCVQAVAPAPAVSNLGLFLATAVLLALGLVAILSRRRGWPTG